MRSSPKIIKTNDLSRAKSKDRCEWTSLSGELSVRPISWDEFSLEISPRAPMPPTDEALFRAEEERRSWEAMKEEAIQWSRECIQEAKTRAEAIEQEAYQKGLSQGEKKGREMGLKELEPVGALLRQLLEEVGSLRQRIWEKSESDLVALSLAIAKGILHREVALDGEVIVRVAREALKNVAAGEWVKIRVNPADLEALTAHRDQLLDPSDGARGLQIEEDSSIARGGCLVESSLGEVDARIERQMEILETALRSAHHEPKPQPSEA
ncbi:MAG: hypothetical protein HYY20_03900 [Candidatus Tectomicrobia bacterium]|uniref:Flagellar assembly protein FliH n=1 Tax=Tectimicrobiota bacterium TaxID=2528274 RepID=A0A932CMU3_UNCTE|nr:hypothetical protein [Candidatus Tectomicrobia bacterium]